MLARTLGIVLLATACALGQATPPSLLHLQGRLADNAGQPVTSSMRDLRVEFYDSAIGGLLLGTSNVVDPVITNGVYAVSLAIPAGMCANNAAVFMEMAVGDGAAGADGAFEVLSPRTRVLASAYALNADTLDGRDSSFFAQASSSFVQNGNAFGALATLGTNDAFDLVFETNGAEVARVTAGGRVGIGTTTPSVELQVVGQTRSSSFSSADGTAGLPAFRFESDTDVGMFRPAANTLSLTTGGTERVTIGPTGDVSVQGNTLTFSNPFGSGMVTTTANAFLSIASAGAGTLFLEAGTTGAIRMRTGVGDRLYIENNGNVGIGTTGPDHLLHVAGSLRLNTAFPFRFGAVGEASDEINFTRTNPAANRADLTLTLGDDGWNASLGSEEHFIIAAANVGRLLDVNTNRGLEIANRLKIFSTGDQSTNFVPNSCAGNYVVGGGIIEFPTDPGGG